MPLTNGLKCFRIWFRNLKRKYLNPLVSGPGWFRVMKTTGGRKYCWTVPLNSSKLLSSLLSKLFSRRCWPNCPNCLLCKLFSGRCWPNCPNCSLTAESCSTSSLEMPLYTLCMDFGTFNLHFHLTYCIFYHCLVRHSFLILFPLWWCGSGSVRLRINSTLSCGI